MISSHQFVRLASALSAPRMIGSAAKGIITSAMRPTSGPAKPAGMTPTMVNGLCSSVIVAPTAVSAPPKRRCQKRWLITATLALASGRSSAGPSRRPRTALTPSTSKRRPLT